MKHIFLSIAIIFSLSAFGQGTSVKQDTAAIRKEQEAINKFIGELVTKTSIADFQKWMYDNNAGVKDFEVFNRMYNAFIQQKYVQSKEQPKK
jgi:hypothetical protein